MRRSFFNFGRPVVLAGAILAYLAGTLAAQPAPEAPPGYPSPADEAAAIHAYLCLQREIAALRADMTAKQQALAAVRQQLAALNEELAGERSRIDVNNPEAVAHYKVLLERRDALAKNSLAPAIAADREAVERYDAAVQTYNERYANRSYDSDMVAQIRANLSCAPSR
jgi:hypothetical protein